MGFSELGEGWRPQELGGKMISEKLLCKQAAVIDTAQARVFRMKKGVMTAARLVEHRLRDEKIRWVPLMVTLTYSDVTAWRPDHITDLMRNISRWGLRAGYRLPYVWVMELQKRGAPHYHVLVWIPARLRIPRADSRGWWPHGTTNTIRVRNSVGYVAKYASKFESKDAEFPKGSRIHGIGGITESEKRVVAWWKLPKDLRQGEEGSCRWRRLPGGGWINPDSGEKVAPQWRLYEANYSSGRMVIEKAPLDQEVWNYRQVMAQAKIDASKLLKKMDAQLRVVSNQHILDAITDTFNAIRAEINFDRSGLLSGLRDTDLVACVRYWDSVERANPAF